MYDSDMANFNTHRVRVFNRLDTMIMQMWGQLVYERKNHLVIFRVRIGKRTFRDIEVTVQHGMRVEIEELRKS